MPYVYRYKDLFDERFKYIGIVKGYSNNDLIRRIKQHRKDNWFRNSDYSVDYIEVATRCDAEAIEGSLISKYETYKYYNKAKASWGESSIYKIDDSEWIEYGTESLQNIYRNRIAELEKRISKLSIKNDELEDWNRLLHTFIIQDGMHTITYAELEESLMEKRDRYEEYSMTCSTKTSADKWAYRANIMKRALLEIEVTLLEHTPYNSKEYKEDHTQKNYMIKEEEAI